MDTFINCCGRIINCCGRISRNNIIKDIKDGGQKNAKIQAIKLHGYVEF